MAGSRQAPPGPGSEASLHGEPAALSLASKAWALAQRWQWFPQDRSNPALHDRFAEPHRGRDLTREELERIGDREVRKLLVGHAPGTDAHDRYTHWSRSLVAVAGLVSGWLRAALDREPEPSARVLSMRA